MTPPTFPDFKAEVVRGAVVARSDDPAEPDTIIGCAVVGECLIRDRKARAVVHLEDRTPDKGVIPDEALIMLARPGLTEAFEELYASTYSGLRLPPRH